MEMKNLIASEQYKKKQYKDLHLPSSTISPIELQINKESSSFYDFFNFMSYWEQANIFRHHFYIERSTNNIGKDNISFNSFAYMDYWYEALYSLIEGYLKLGYIHDKVNLLLDSDHSLLKSLKSYRHATFHYAKIYHNSPLKDRLLKEQKSPKWLSKLHVHLTIM